MTVFEEKPWLKFYEPHVPEHIDYPESTMPAALAESAAKYPQRNYLVYKGNEISYEAFNRDVERFAAALQAFGIEKGDRVAIHLPNCPQFPMAYFATLRIGAVAVPCNPVYTARELSHQLKDSGARIAITLTAFYPIVKKVRPETKLEHVIVAKIKTYFPGTLRILYTLLKEKKDGHRVSIDGDANTHWFGDVLESAPEKPSPVEVNGDDLAVLMYTGGTTGLSKGAQLSHSNIFINAYQAKVWINASDEAESTLTTLPLFHSYGMTTCMNLSALTSGTAILVPNPRDIDDIIKTIHKERPDYYPGVPAMYVAVNNYPDLHKYDLSSLKTCSSGAAPLAPEVQKKFQAITGGRLNEGYGLSETSPVTHGNPAYGESRIGTIGLPWPDTEVKIVDAETGERLIGIDEEGELCVRGPQVMKGYWNMPTETANTLRSDPDGGRPWLHTGDIATMDEDGYFRIVDRKKDMILGAGGFNIYPREIEDVLYENPKVLEGAAAGVPVEGKGERVKAYIVLKPGESATQEEIIAFCREHLAPYKVPKFVEFRDELPKTLVGKVLRRELVREEKERQAAHES
jgi:long-chain acyl-CoA synthetase